jgi:hypothetical protein
MAKIKVFIISIFPYNDRYIWTFRNLSGTADATENPIHRRSITKHNSDGNISTHFSRFSAGRMFAEMTENGDQGTFAKFSFKDEIAPCG